MSSYAIVYFGETEERLANIERDEFNRTRVAIAISHGQLGIEQRYGILLENYKELEQELLNFSLNVTLNTSNGWETLEDATPLFHRRVLNFLSSARMYLDQIPGELLNASRNADQVKLEFDKLRSTEYDNSLGYRVCEALRNYTQHKSLPVHRISYGMRREAAAKTVTNYSGLGLSVSVLEADRKFKASVLKELRSVGEKHDLKRFIREYMHGLGEVHINLRKHLRDDGAWAISESVGRYKSAIAFLLLRRF